MALCGITLYTIMQNGNLMPYSAGTVVLLRNIATMWHLSALLSIFSGIIPLRRHMTFFVILLGSSTTLFSSSPPSSENMVLGIRVHLLPIVYKSISKYFRRRVWERVHSNKHGEMVDCRHCIPINLLLKHSSRMSKPIISHSLKVTIGPSSGVSNFRDLCTKHF